MILFKLESSYIYITLNESCVIREPAYIRFIIVKSKSFSEKILRICLNIMQYQRLCWPQNFLIVTLIPSDFTRLGNYRPWCMLYIIFLFVIVLNIFFLFLLFIVQSTEFSILRSAEVEPNCAFKLHVVKLYKFLLSTLSVINQYI